MKQFIQFGDEFINIDTISSIVATEIHAGSGVFPVDEFKAGAKIVFRDGAHRFKVMEHKIIHDTPEKAIKEARILLAIKLNGN